MTAAALADAAGAPIGSDRLAWRIPERTKRSRPTTRQEGRSLLIEAAYQHQRDGRVIACAPKARITSVANLRSWGHHTICTKSYAKRDRSGAGPRSVTPLAR